jgi:hypothetical protein
MFINVNKTWEDAENFCRERGGYLMMSRTYKDEIGEMVDAGFILDVPVWADNEHAAIEYENDFFGQERDTLCPVAFTEMAEDDQMVDGDVLAVEGSTTPIPGSLEGVDRTDTGSNRKTKWDKADCLDKKPFVCEANPIV